MNTYDRIIRDYHFVPDATVAQQHKKILEEMFEVMQEAVIVDGTESFVLKNTLEEYLFELLDVSMAINNQLLVVEGFVGEKEMKEMLHRFDKKMKYYKKVKYNKSEVTNDK